MEDVKELLEGIRDLVSKADDVTRMHKEIDLNLYLQISIARDYLDRRLNQIQRIARAA